MLLSGGQSTRRFLFCLFFPTVDATYPSDISFCDGITSSGDHGMMEDLVLDFGGEVKKVHNLSQARTADLAEASKFGLGRDRAGADEFVEVDCEGKQLRDSRQSARWGCF